MASTGFTLPGTGANTTGIGTISWSNPGNITTDNGSNATPSASTKSAQMNYLTASNFGFAIPTGSVINGIEVRVQALYTVAASTPPAITHIIVVRDGSTLGDNLSSGASLTTGATNYTFGDATELWGLTWTAAQINASNFQFRFSCSTGLNAGFSAGCNPSVDVMWINVHYTPPAGGNRGFIIG